MNLKIEAAHIDQEIQIQNLYEKVASVPNGIIRNKNEINKEYISGFMNRSFRNGLILAGLLDDIVVGEIHAYTPTIYAFKHILTDLTIVVDPIYHRQGIGRRLFEEFLRIVMEKYNHILRIELYVREQNENIVRFYESLGFINEGRQEFKIFSSESEFETPLHMAWFNPNYGQSQNNAQLDKTESSAQ